MCVAELRFLALVTVEHDEALAPSRARDAALAALGGIGPNLFPAFAEGRDGEEHAVTLCWLEILDESHLPCAALWVCAGEGGFAHGPDLCRHRENRDVL
jgi:hypothetical protein